MSTDLSSYLSAQNNFFKGLVIGDTGAGKTCGLENFPRNMHVFDCDNKIDSLAKWMNYRNMDMTGITVDNCSRPIPTQAGFAPQPAVKFVEAKISTWVKDPASCPKTIVLDSITTFGELLMHYLVHVNTAINRIKLEDGWATSMQDFGVFKPFLRGIIQGLLSLPCNVVCIGHIKSDKNEVTGEIFHSAMIPGALARELPIYFPEVYRAYMKDGKTFVQTQSDGKYSLRSQIPGLPKNVAWDYNEISKFMKIN